MHNLFGDTDAVHISLDRNGYNVDHVVQGDTVSDVLTYVSYHKHELIELVRKAAEQGILKGELENLRPNCYYNTTNRDLLVIPILKMATNENMGSANEYHNNRIGTFIFPWTCSKLVFTVTKFLIYSFWLFWVTP